MVALNGVQQDATTALRGLETSQSASKLNFTGNITYSSTDHASKAPKDLLSGLRNLPKHIPCRFLYDKAGSQIYEQITKLEEYYPFETEKRLLELNSEDIVRHVPPASVVAELGVGDAGKTGFLLDQLLKRDGKDNVHFYGIDCSAEALNQARHNLQQHSPDLDPSHLSLIEAEYLEGVAEVRRRNPDAMLCLLWLGSSVGNFSHQEAASFLQALMTAAGERSQMLLCTDLWKEHETLRAAYHDSQGVTEAFIKNGMRNALRTLGQPKEVCQPERWEYVTQVNARLQQVEMYLVSKHAIPELVPGVSVGTGEAVLMEVSRKFTPASVADLAYNAGLCIQASWGDPAYRMQLLLPPRQALLRCWQDSDSLFSHIEDWNTQPIGLRHPFCFYYGHVAAFAKLKMLPEERATPLDQSFSRGIDPNLLDPSQCHSHPPVPDSWPSKTQLLKYVAQVRREILENLGGQHGSPFNMHVLCMCLEHERMHQETLCYMMAQQRKREFLAPHLPGSEEEVLQPPTPVLNMLSEKQQKGCQPDHETRLLHLEAFYLQQCSYADAKTLRGQPLALCTPTVEDHGTRQAGRSVDGPSSEGAVRIPPSQVQLGLGMDGGWGYVWDNEVGYGGMVPVAAFTLPPSPVTVRKFREFVLGKAYERRGLWEALDWEFMQSMGIRMPATWSLHEPSAQPGSFLVHMPEGSFSWEQVAECPVYVSLSEALAYCRAHGGRIMTEAEYASASQHLAGMKGGRCATAAASLQEGGWEWTSSLLEPFQGFQADPKYPEYSTDFFDGHHYVLKGSSPYTHPSLRRDSFRNFYQKQYPYVFAKFRMLACTD